MVLMNLLKSVSDATRILSDQNKFILGKNMFTIKI